jgi:outer membrane protein OmpA-like peptidoglycan-associated protein
MSSSRPLRGRATVRILAACLLLATPLVAQEAMTREHWTTSLSAVGAADWGGLRIDGTDRADRGFAWAAGLALEIPIRRHFSIEPQLQYATWRFGQPTTSTSFPGDATPAFLSLPVLLKWHLGGHDGHAVALMVGPQVDYALSLNDDRNVFETGDVARPSYAATAGIEIAPRSRLSLYARYIHGFTNLDGTDNPNTRSKYYLQGIQGGLRLRLFGGHWKTPPAPPAPAAPVDSDGDGIADAADRCPTIRGTAQYQGCPVPDTDKDGIADDQDRCPSVAGVAQYQGCPVPDTDKDGIADDQDRCPSVAGVVRYQGCPVPDTDKDGIADDQDRCPTVAGIAAMQGCPAIERFDAHEVTFATNKAILTAKGKAELDLVIAYLRTHDVKVQLTGHTDDVGPARVNDPLSVRRAEAAAAYMATKGIARDRMELRGVGSAEPAVNEKTAAARARNRRVEVVVR